MYRRLPQPCSKAWGRLHIQNKVDGRPQKVNSIGLSYYGIHGLERSVRQFQVVNQHYDWHLRLDPLDLSCDECTVQLAQMVLEHYCIHRVRHRKPQALGAVGRGDQLVSLFLQQGQSRRIPVNTKQGAIGSHSIQV